MIPITVYNSIDMQRELVGDEVRTSRFRESIRATVSRGDVVLDVGTGSGILSLFAAQAGAARVYAVDREPGAVALARRLVADNGFDDRVRVIGGEIEQLTLPEQADVVIFEWLGVYGVDENLLAPLLTARDRWLRPGGVLIPGEVTSWIAPVAHPAATEALRYRDTPYDLNLTALAPDPNEVVWLPRGAAEGDLRADPTALWSVDPLVTPRSRALQPFAAEVTFRLTRGGVNGLVAWFTAEMPGTDALSTSPAAPRTHWGHFLFPITSALTAQAGDALSIGFHNVPGAYGDSHHLWSVHSNGRPIEVHDTRRLGRHPGEPPWWTAMPT